MVTAIVVAVTSIIFVEPEFTACAKSRIAPIPCSCRGAVSARTAWSICRCRICRLKDALLRALRRELGARVALHPMHADLQCKRKHVRWCAYVQ